LNQVTLKAWDEFQATGLHATAEEVDKWLASWGTENELPSPERHKSSLHGRLSETAATARFPVVEES
jgi:hypothetical protein